MLRYDDIETRARRTRRSRWWSTTPSRATRHHGWKFIALRAGRLLYVPVGAPCNICEPDDPRYARDHPHEARRQRPRDLRARHPQHGRLRLASGDAASSGSPTTAATCSGDDVPPRRAEPRAQAGHELRLSRTATAATSPIRSSATKHACSEFTPPAQKLGPHVAALGMRFYTGTHVPGRVSRTRSSSPSTARGTAATPIGYRVIAGQRRRRARRSPTSRSPRAGCERRSAPGAGRRTCW